MTDREWLTEKVASIKDVKLRFACGHVLKDERFFVSPAAVKKHQAWTGGLATHVRGVMDIAVSMALADHLKNIASLDVVISGTLWHDFGKIWDYKRNQNYPGQNKDGEPEPEWAYDRHRWTTRHLVRSYAEFFKVATEIGVNEDLIEEVGHAILAHHGRHEYGSPVMPMTVEASIIHFADSLDAFHVGKDHVFRTKRTDWKKP